MYLYVLRHHYSQYLTAQVIDGGGRPLKSTRSSFYYYLYRLEWIPAYRLLENEQQERQYLCPNSVYLTSPEIRSLLGTHVSYVDVDPSEFTRALGNRSFSHFFTICTQLFTVLCVFSVF